MCFIWYFPGLHWLVYLNNQNDQLKLVKFYLNQYLTKKTFHCFIKYIVKILERHRIKVIPSLRAGPVLHMIFQPKIMMQRLNVQTVVFSFHCVSIRNENNPYYTSYIPQRYFWSSVLFVKYNINVWVIRKMSSNLYTGKNLDTNKRKLSVKSLVIK